MDEKKRQQLEGQLSAYLDNELSETERAEIEAFLAEYEEARELLAELRATIEIVKQLPRAKASDQMMDGLRARLERDALLGQTSAQREGDAVASALLGLVLDVNDCFVVFAHERGNVERLALGLVKHLLPELHGLVIVETK